MPIKISSKVTLNEGDKIRVSGGPYFMSKSGNKVCMGEKGVGVFTGVVDEKENAIFVKFNTGIPKYVYIGPEYISETTGTVMKAHKIVKARK